MNELLGILNNNKDKLTAEYNVLKNLNIKNDKDYENTLNSYETNILKLEDTIEKLLNDNLIFSQYEINSDIQKDWKDRQEFNAEIAHSKEYTKEKILLENKIKSKYIENNMKYLNDNTYINQKKELETLSLKRQFTNNFIMEHVKLLAINCVNINDKRETLKSIRNIPSYINSLIVHLPLINKKAIVLNKDDYKISSDLYTYKKIIMATNLCGSDVILTTSEYSDYRYDIHKFKLFSYTFDLNFEFKTLLDNCHLNYEEKQLIMIDLNEEAIFNKDFKLCLKFIQDLNKFSEINMDFRVVLLTENTKVFNYLKNFDEIQSCTQFINALED